MRIRGFASLCVVSVIMSVLMWRIRSPETWRLIGYSLIGYGAGAGLAVAVFILWRHAVRYKTTLAAQEHQLQQEIEDASVQQADLWDIVAGFGTVTWCSLMSGETVTVYTPSSLDSTAVPARPQVKAFVHEAQGVMRVTFFDGGVRTITATTAAIVQKRAYNSHLTKIREQEDHDVNPEQH